ncbi:uncharacterized protein LOC144132431 isoform X2 [Amblyomma americanum]
MAVLFKGVIFAFNFLLLLDSTAAVHGPNLLHRQIPDAFEVYARMPHIVAISDSNNDTIFECLSAKRTHFDPKAKEVTYVVMFKGHHGTEKKHVAFYVSAGSTPNTILFTDDEHPDVPQTGEIAYTNHRNCFVVHFPYIGEHSLLYVTGRTRKILYYAHEVGEHRQRCAQAVHSLRV